MTGGGGGAALVCGGGGGVAVAVTLEVVVERSCSSLLVHWCHSSAIPAATSAAAPTMTASLRDRLGVVVVECV